MEDGEDMAKYFNTVAVCRPNQHYMVDISDKLEQIGRMIDAGWYFTINRARQYGKTTTLKALAKFLEKNYVVVSLDFQRMSASDFKDEASFVMAFAREISAVTGRRDDVPKKIQERLEEFADGQVRNTVLSVLFGCLNQWCRESEKKIVLIIDEADSASNNQVFLDLLALLRVNYIDRDEIPTFHSVILAGVYDVKNLKRKFTADGEHKENSPWNIAADFTVDMSFSLSAVAGMLSEYEQDYHTGMDIEQMAELIYEYTAGYPFLVSRLCKLLDECVAAGEAYPDRSRAWTRDGFQEAVHILLKEKNTLFESMINKLSDYPELSEMLYMLLFGGKTIPYTPLNSSIQTAEMFGFIKQAGDNVAVTNRIFETILYDHFLSKELLNNKMYDAGLKDKGSFIRNGHLDMRYILEKFIIHFNDLYGDRDGTFYEDDGRRYFLLYLRPIINGKGNYYIEAETRNRERTDVIIDYGGEQIIVELKVWHGNAYHARGEKQLLDYLEYYHLDAGYMLSFNFNKNKKAGIKEVTIGDKLLIEAVV